MRTDEAVPATEPVDMTPSEALEVLALEVGRAGVLDRLVAKLVRVQDHRMAISLTTAEADEYYRILLATVDEGALQRLTASGFAEPVVVGA